MTRTGMSIDIFGVEQRLELTQQCWRLLRLLRLISAWLQPALISLSRGFALQERLLRLRTSAGGLCEGARQAQRQRGRLR